MEDYLNIIGNTITYKVGVKEALIITASLVAVFGTGAFSAIIHSYLDNRKFTKIKKSNKLEKNLRA